MYDVDSLCGMSIVAKRPLSIKIMLNIKRPYVLRQYYGCDRDVANNNIIRRATYGYESAFGTDF